MFDKNFNWKVYTYCDKSCYIYRDIEEQSRGNGVYLDNCGATSRYCNYFWKTESEAEEFLERYLMNERLKQVEKDIKLLEEERKRLLKENEKTWKVGDILKWGSDRAEIIRAGHDAVVFVNPKDKNLWLVNNYCPLKVNDLTKITKKELQMAGFGSWEI